LRRVLYDLTVANMLDWLSIIAALQLLLLLLLLLLMMLWQSVYIRYGD